MNVAAWRRHRRVNALQSAALILALAAILSALGWVIAGSTGVLWALLGGVCLVLLNPGLSPRLVLTMYGARRLSAAEAPRLQAVMEALSARAALPAVPELYYVASNMLNAFAVGTPRAAAVAVTDGLLRTLSLRELTSVLAHELSHVRHNDMWVMGLADLFSRLTSLLSTLGQVLLLVNLPLLVFSEHRISWTAILTLVLAPTLSALIQLALSRAREYDADLGAAELTGDPRGLALALERMERYQGRFVEQILFPGRRVPDPSLLRTHPPVAERIRRLLELEPAREHIAGSDTAWAKSPVVGELRRGAFPPVPHRPRWHLNGVWY